MLIIRLDVQVCRVKSSPLCSEVFEPLAPLKQCQYYNELGGLVFNKWNDIIVYNKSKGVPTKGAALGENEALNSTFKRGVIEHYPASQQQPPARWVGGVIPRRSATYFFWIQSHDHTSGLVMSCGGGQSEVRYWKDAQTHVARSVFLRGSRAEHFRPEECGSLWRRRQLSISVEPVFYFSKGEEERLSVALSQFFLLVG